MHIEVCYCERRCKHTCGCRFGVIWTKPKFELFQEIDKSNAYTRIEMNQVTYGIVFTISNKQAAVIFMAFLASVLRTKPILKLMREINESYACMKFGRNQDV